MKLCPKCELPLIEGLALENSQPTERPGFLPHIPKSNGTLVKCFKCSSCGYSEIEENKLCK